MGLDFDIFSSNVAIFVNECFASGAEGGDGFEGKHNHIAAGAEAAESE
jgi:hypothetical protein